MRRPVMRRAVTGTVADTGVARVAMAPGERKRVAFAEADVEAQTVRRYHPGATTSPEGRP